MDEENPVKDTLYDYLKKIPEEKLRQLATNETQTIIKEIISDCHPKIKALSGNIDENLSTFAISLMHYLLTNTLIPSQRKITVNQVDIDIVIPDLQTLSANPNDALVIYFSPKDDAKIINSHISELQKIQPNNQNIWIVTQDSYKGDHKIFYIKKDECAFSNIISEIQKFLSVRKQNPFKILK